MREDPRDGMRRLGRKADEICSHILLDDYPLIDIEIERAGLREECEALFPDRLWLYDIVYESRFERFLEQWRSEAGGGPWSGDPGSWPDEP
jgi:hypothetical protein